MLIFLASVMAMMISVTFMYVAVILSFNMKESFEKCTPFECGFDPMSKNRLPFSIRFFLLAVIFLIFDLEIILLFPFLVNNIFLTHLSSLTMVFLFIFILLVGTLYEWKNGALSWIC